MKDISTAQTTQFLQWIKGDKIGNIEKVASNDDEWTYFENGARIASSLIPEFMMECDSDLTEPKQIKNKHSQKNNVNTNTEKTETALSIIFNKQKNTESHNLHLTFEINVPNKDFLKIMKSTFGDDDINDELYAYINKQIDIQDLNSSIQKNIEKFIKDLNI